jgi:hypothetical protein
LGKVFGKPMKIATMANISPSNALASQRRRRQRESRVHIKQSEKTQKRKCDALPPSKIHRASALFLLEYDTARLWGVIKAPDDDAGGKESPMCDFSLQSVRSRPAKVSDKLVTRDFGTGTRGFAAADDFGTAVCLLPGTELAFADPVACLPAGLLGWKTKTINHQTAIFRQVNKEKLAAHHDALEFPDGRTVLLTLLCEDQAATVLQLPAQPKTETEAREQERVGFVG